jgi:hypothetical protein
MQATRRWRALGALAFFGLAAPAAGESSDEIAALRAEIQAMRTQYEAKIEELTERVEAAEAAARTAQTASAPTPAGAPASASAFNPQVSAILLGRAAHLSGPEGHRDVPGFLLGEETGVGPEGLSLDETELNFNANADDKFYGSVTVALAAEDGETEIELEEAYLQTLALPEGFTLKGGQFFSGIGYLNAKHAHAWDFVDMPLAYEAFLGTQFADPGVQLTWVAPTDTYLQLGAELFRGDRFPAGGADHSGVGAWSAFAKVSGEVGDSHTWQAGLSYLSSDAVDRESEDVAGNLFAFTGDSDLAMLDFVWKWAPQGNYRERNLTLQAELFHRRERGRLDADLGGAPASGDYRSDASGLYAQAVYQFMPRWRIGARYDQLWSDDELDFAAPSSLDDAENPARASLMVDFSNSEFSHLRLQWSRQWGGLEGNDAVFLQYFLSIGAHGAHTF